MPFPRQKSTEFGRDMETEEPQVSPRLNEKTLSNMKLFCDVAKANGDSVSLKELIALTSIDFTERQLEDSWKDYDFLSSRYRIESGIVLETHTGEDVDPSELAFRKKEDFQRASSNISFASRFGSFLGSDNFKVLSISGSTSYLSASKTDDLDFFCISESGKMWKSFVKSLVLARSFRLLQKDSPWLCLSYVADEQFAKREFACSRDGLFARDAISARVIHGEEFYSNLLRENSWMAEYFPKLYSLQLKKSSNEQNVMTRSSTLGRIINLFLYYTAGSYIKLKSHLLNRKFSRDRKLSSMFKLRIGVDHCIYESQDYLRLRKMYAEFRAP
jgi:hypothetical protein